MTSQFGVESGERRLDLPSATEDLSLDLSVTSYDALRLDLTQLKMASDTLLAASTCEDGCECMKLSVLTE